jgi:hypothetical protein
MSTATTLSCPKCKTVLRPAKPLRAGKTVTCPKCRHDFVVGGPGPKSDPAKAPKPAPIQKKPSTPPVPIAPVSMRDDDDDEGGVITYTVQTEEKVEGPGIDYAPDVGIRDLRGPAMSAIVNPSNKLILVGVTGFIGWLAFLVVLLVPILFPLESKEERAKAEAIKNAQLALTGITVPGGPAAPAKADDDEASFLKVGSINLRAIGDFRWYLVIPCLLPLIFGMIYSGTLSMGAVKIQNLESREWGIASSVMAMLPLNAGGVLCFMTLVLNICLDFLFEGMFKWIVLGFFLLCIWGVNLAIGIWMLTVLNNPDVVAGFEYVPD